MSLSGSILTGTKHTQQIQQNCSRHALQNHSKNKPCRRPLVTSALHIDRRAHLERAWQTQQAKETALLRTDGSATDQVVQEISSLAQLESIVEASGSSIVAVALYTRSCGACKQLLRHYKEYALEMHQQRGGVKFLTHNVRDDFDDVTDLARLYKVKAVPCFLFFSGGALMRSMPMPDSRLDPGAIRKLIGAQAGQLQVVIREMLFRDTPSARR